MARQYAIAIGINQYRYYPERPLRFAENDAVAMQALLEEIGFQETRRYSDTSPTFHDQSTLPERTNLLLALHEIETSVRLKEEDSFWFFFSGHGARQAGRDYLLPTDGNPRLLSQTAIAIEDVISSLRRCGAGNLVLILDACRNQVPDLSREIGLQTADLARQEGIITLFSCKPNEFSYELENLERGAFTFALLEALRGDCRPDSANAQQLSQYLRQRVPALVRDLGNQTPYVVAEPVEKAVQSLLPAPVVLPKGNEPLTPNLDRLEADIYRATYVDKNFEQAEQLWEQFNQYAATPQDRVKAGQLIRAITKMQHQANSPIAATPEVIQPVLSPPSSAPKTAVPKNPTVPTFEFEVVKVDKFGNVVDTQHKRAEFQTVDLGNGLALELVLIPKGKFMMGSPASEKGRNEDERPQPQVTVNAFLMGKYPVTQAQWKAVAALPKVSRDLDVDPAQFKGGNQPVERISWNDATEFCARLSKKTGQEYRLPSEAEWEYACRAGTITPFYFGETITPDLVNYDGDYTYGGAPKGVYREKTTDVGIFPPNGFGLYDMHGNVWEWCQDIWHDNYAGAPTDGTAWVEGGIGDRTPKMLRGGSWCNVPGACRSAFRYNGSANGRNDNVGFRVACSLARAL